MQTHHFENLEVWKRGCRLAVDVCAAAAPSKDFALKDQITRAALSIPSNIAEGAERGSDADFTRFLSYSKGSCGELRTQLLIHLALSKQLGIEPFTGTQAMIEETRELSKMLGAIIHKLSPSA
jgi:four helix bundle protein